MLLQVNVIIFKSFWSIRLETKGGVLVIFLREIFLQVLFFCLFEVLALHQSWSQMGLERFCILPILFLGFCVYFYELMCLACEGDY